MSALECSTDFREAIQHQLKRHSSLLAFFLCFLDMKTGGQSYSRLAKIAASCYVVIITFPQTFDVPMYKKLAIVELAPGGYRH
jgi:hypothetical protein